jgi:hypothetical protein
MDDAQETDKSDISCETNMLPGEEKTRDASSEKEQGKESVIVKFLRLNKAFRLPALSVFVLLGLATMVGLSYLCWYIWLPSLWRWGFEPTTWKSIFSVLGALYLIIIPFLPFGLSDFVGQIINLYLDEQQKLLSDKFSALNKGQQSIEEKLEKNDKSGIIILIRYSRLQLEAYYRIGLDQTHRSFRYSIIAMWIGFIIIISGVAINFLPISIRILFESSNVKDITILGGTVIEIISALFLWVYRSSINQLTYFYNRQMDNHNVIICHRIAETMEKSDDTKKIIIEKILDRGQKAEISGLRIPGIAKNSKE